jgi:hypothetical protein
MKWDASLSKEVKENKTQQEIDVCKDRAKNSAIQARHYDLKDMFITSAAWLIVFLILF